MVDIYSFEIHSAEFDRIADSNQKNNEILSRYSFFYIQEELL